MDTGRGDADPTWTGRRHPSFVYSLAYLREVSVSSVRSPGELSGVGAGGDFPDGGPRLIKGPVEGNEKEETF